MLRNLAAPVLLGHGLIHLLGFIVYWRIGLVEGLGYPSDWLAGWLGASAEMVKIVGLLWLVAAIGFAAGGVGLLLDRPWSQRVIASTAALSLVLCVLAWPDARFGAVIDLVILAAIVTGPFLLPHITATRTGQNSGPAAPGVRL